MEKEQYEHITGKIEELMSQKEQVVVVIEGGSASGKTTLAEKLCRKYKGNVFHTDDFFLQPWQRTKERLEEPGGNVDRERFLSEVICPLKKGEEILYRRFDCCTMSFLPAVKILPGKLNIVEGAYSMHPEFGKYYDLSIFLDVTPKLQKERILKRNTEEKAKRFFEEWIPMEINYWGKMEIPKDCDIIMRIS